MDYTDTCNNGASSELVRLRYITIPEWCSEIRCKVWRKNFEGFATQAWVTKQDMTQIQCELGLENSLFFSFFFFFATI